MGLILEIGYKLKKKYVASSTWQAIQKSVKTCLQSKKRQIIATCPTLLIPLRCVQLAYRDASSNNDQPTIICAASPPTAPSAHEDNAQQAIAVTDVERDCRRLPTKHWSSLDRLSYVCIRHLPVYLTRLALTPPLGRVEASLLVRLLRGGPLSRSYASLRSVCERILD